MPEPEKKAQILTVTKKEQYRTVDELLERSKASSTYYTLLVLSSFIIAAGLLLGNAPIVIGGMLVTPVLTPVLAVALGLATGEVRILKNVIILLAKSFGIVMASSILMAFIFGTPLDGFALENTARADALYFIVAIAAGVAATFAWARREIAEVLPGIAIAVALVPPLSFVGIWISALNFELARFYFLVFLFNLIGIIIGSLIVFSLLKFYRAKGEVVKKAKEEEKTSGQKPPAKV